ncbi:MAG: C-terminal binding protein [Candidatus Accumulibacter sp.]|jgi:D-3-phosphoglycerate dehydrogenase|nr:C-terminal binding protein [Accumulibacter sp.]
MSKAPLRVVIVDRHAWYLPEIEKEEFGRIGAEVAVGWAETPSRPAAADEGWPETEEERRRLSRLSSDYVSLAVTTEDEVIRMACGAAAILVVRADITARVMDALPDLRVIARYGIGIDNIDAAAAKERGIAVVNAPGFCAREVADHTMMLVLALSRQLTYLQDGLRAGRWLRAVSPMRALYSQTLGLVGFGGIGQEVARRAAAFGMSVTAYDPFIDAARARELGVTPVGFDDLLRHADYVSLHLPLSAQTRQLIGERQLSLMKPTALLVNTSRGALVDQRALIVALESRTIAGAGLDVFETEPLPVRSPLLKRSDVALTSHIGGYSDESAEQLRRMVARATADLLAAGAARR